MKNNHLIKITNDINNDQICLILDTIFNKKKKFILNLNLTEYTNGVFSLLKFKEVLEKYRPLTRKYLIHTNIILDNEFVVVVLRIVTAMFKPDKPVYYRSTKVSTKVSTTGE